MPDKPLPFVIHVRRGDGRLNYKMTLWELVTVRVHEMNWRVATDFVHLQNSRPDDPPLVDTTSERQMGLKLPERDNVLLPTLTLRVALDGKWQEMDAQQLGPQGLDPTMSRARVVTLDFADRR